MSYYKYGLSADPSFQMGMALGNAYGNLWASNAKKRNEAQMDDVVQQYMNDQRMQQLANPIEEKSLMTEAINGNYTSDNANGINNNVSGIGKYNRNYGLATPQNIIDEAKRRGIHQEVIDERMKGVREQIASKAKSQYMPQINQLIYGSMDANGNYVAPTQADYLRASGLIDDYRKYDTAGADKLTETLNNRQLGQLQHLANRQQALDDYRFRKANGIDNTNNSQYLNVALKRLGALDDIANANGGTLPFEHEGEYEKWTGVLGINWKSPTEKALVAELGKEGANQDKIFSDLKSYLNDGERYQKFYKKYYNPNLVKAKQEEIKKAEPKQEAQPKEDDKQAMIDKFIKARTYAIGKGVKFNALGKASANKGQEHILREAEAMYGLPEKSLSLGL